jgi:hypothetical protein
MGTRVNFGGMTGRGRAVIFKFNFSKSCDHKKSFLLRHGVRNSNVHHVYIFLIHANLEKKHQRNAYAYS